MWGSTHLLTETEREREEKDLLKCNTNHIAVNLLKCNLNIVLGGSSSGDLYTAVCVFWAQYQVMFTDCE